MSSKRTPLSYLCRSRSIYSAGMQFDNFAGIIKANSSRDAVPHLASVHDFGLIPAGPPPPVLTTVPGSLPDFIMAQQMFPRRILVIDDNHDAADTTADLLECYGHVTRTAYGGAEGLLAAQDFSPDVVFLDIGMPGLDGYEVAAKLRDTPGFDKTLVVALTAWGDPQSRARAAQAGFNKHLVKPASLDAMLSVLGASDTAS